jgi:hypothetical protein
MRCFFVKGGHMRVDLRFERGLVRPKMLPVVKIGQPHAAAPICEKLRSFHNGKSNAVILGLRQ